MPGYIKKSLHNFQHPTLKIPQHDAHEWTDPAYGSIVQYNHTEPDLTTLYPVGTQCVQSIPVILLDYLRLANPTMLLDLNNISTQQSKPTTHTITKYKRPLDYAETYPTSVIQYHASDMILHDDTYAAYLVLTKPHI